MHILLTNDDGPPQPEASPYIATFVSVLQSPPFNHRVSVVLPSTQRSWIGKAHLLPPSRIPGQVQPVNANENLSEVLTPSYYDPRTARIADTPTNLFKSSQESQNTDSQPSQPSESQDGDVDMKDASAVPNQSPTYWVLVPGTPAACVQLGIFHHNELFPTTSGATPPPIDLVLSGPNYGRNTTAAFALSSGTLGGALEGAICGVPAIALSFAFFTRQESQALVRNSSELGCRIVERLFRLPWGEEQHVPGETSGSQAASNSGRKYADVYSINIPLVEGVADKPPKWTWMLDNKWRTGSLYKVTNPENAQSEGEDRPVSFKWSPTFGDIWRNVAASPPGNDGLVIRDGVASVTPLMANFEGLHGQEGFTGEIDLSS